MKLFISDDLPGIEEAVWEIFPSAKWQLCVLHTVRDTLAKVRKKGREALAQALKAIWRADTVKQAHRALRTLEEKWARKYPKLVAKWVKKTTPCWSSLTIPKVSGSTFTPPTSWNG